MLETLPQKSVIVTKSEEIKKSRSSLTHLDIPEIRQVRSYFSDDEDNSDQENQEDILKLAKKQDGLKASRQDLFQQMASNNRLPNAEENSENKDNLSPPSSRSDPKDTVSSDNNDQPFGSEAVPNGIEKTLINNEDSGSSSLDSSLDEIDDSIHNDIGKEAERKNIPQFCGNNGKCDEAMKELDVQSNVPKLPGINFKNPFQIEDTQKALVYVPEFPIEGYLKKKSTNMLGLWKKRYFVLRGKKLYYHEDEKKEAVIGCIDFDLVSAKVEMGQHKRHFKVIIAGSQRIFRLRAKTHESAQTWFDALFRQIKVSMGHQMELAKVAALKRFWKNDRISEASFLEQADTGDLILFRSRSFAAKLQRSFTRSEYDHVGVVLKYNNGELVLFEASGKQGVGLCRWKAFTKNKWHLLYPKIVYRKLTVPRTSEMIEKVEKFVKYSFGKKYDISAKKLLQKKASKNEHENEKTCTFFCSELVAACYKRMGLLPKEISAAQYLPGSFSSEKKLSLLNGAKLGEEHLIHF